MARLWTKIDNFSPADRN